MIFVARSLVAGPIRAASRVTPCRAAGASAAAMAHVCVHAADEASLASVREQLAAAAPLTDGAGGAADGGAAAPPLELHFHAPGVAAAAEHCGAFDAARYYGALQTRTLGRVLLSSARLGSTQAVVQAAAARLPDGALVVADRQSGGRGRGGNGWESPPGCLAFTALARLEMPGHLLPFVQYLVSLALVRAVQGAAAEALGLPEGGGSAAAPALGVRIKWPNDVYAGGAKLAGVLCHSTYRDRRFNVALGVGLNVANAAPTTCVDALVAAAAAAAGRPPPPPVRREALLARALNALEPMLAGLAASGFAPYEAAYTAAWLHTGQRLELEEGGRRVAVVVRGLSPHGYLLAADAEAGEGGQTWELHPDGNSLDFFAGLVRKKLPPA